MAQTATLSPSEFAVQPETLVAEKLAALGFTIGSDSAARHPCLPGFARAEGHGDGRELTATFSKTLPK